MTRTGGKWHERGLAMFLEAEGRHGVLTDIAEMAGVSVSTVAKTVKAKGWREILAQRGEVTETARAQADALAAAEAAAQAQAAAAKAAAEVQAAAEAAELAGYQRDSNIDRHGDLPAVYDADLDDPDVQRQVRKSQRGVGLALLRKGIEALELVEVKSPATIVKIIGQGFDLLREAHGMDERKSSVDVNVSLRAIGKLLTGGEETKQIEATDAEWSPTPEPDWDDVEADDADDDEDGHDA